MEDREIAKQLALGAGASAAHALLLTALVGCVARAAPDPIAEMRRISELADEALSHMPTDEWLVNLIAEQARLRVGAIMADARKYLQKD